MEEVKNREEILRALARKYEKDPSGWTVMLKENRSGYSDFIISTSDELWQIKVDSLYRPNARATGMKVGGKTEARKIASDSSPRFGFRPIPPDLLERFLGGDFEREELRKTIGRVLRDRPVRLSEIDAPGVVQGPVRIGWEGFLSERQKALDAKLRKSLDRSLFKDGLGLGYA